MSKSKKPDDPQKITRAEADAWLDGFIQKLEEEYRLVPDIVVQAGAERVVDYLKGKKNLAQMFNITPDMIRFMIEQGYTQYQTGRYEDADRIFRVLTFLDWKNSYYHSMRGSVLQHQKKYGDAVAEYTEAVRLNPNDIVSWVNRAEIFLIHGHIEYAQFDLNKALKCTGEPKWIERAKTMKDHIAQAFAKTRKEGALPGGKKEKH